MAIDIGQQLGNFLGNIGDAVLGTVQTTNTGTFKFPLNLSSQYAMDIRFFQYSRQSPLQIGTAAERGRISLPIPASVVDAQSINYVEEPIGAALGGAAQGALGGSDLGVLNTAAGATLVGGLSGAGAAAPGLAALASAKFGLSANPFLTVLFKNPNYREYSFSWRLFPRNPNESAVLQNIYRTVKYHMVPAANKGFGGALLTYPSLVKIQIRAGGKSLIPFKYGVIKTSTFNFVPDGAPSFHKSGQPSAVDFNINIQEVEYFLKDSGQAMFSTPLE